MEFPKDDFWSQIEKSDQLFRVCSTCWMIKEGFRLSDTKAEQIYWKRCEERHDPDTHQEIVKKHHTGNGIPQGIFAGTLTMAPKDPFNEKDMINAIQKLMKQKSQPVKRYAWYLEYTDAGTPHIHFIYETITGGRIHKQTFKRAWPIWDETVSVGRGHRGGYHSHCHDEEAYCEYIAKCNNINSDNRWN